MWAAQKVKDVEVAAGSRSSKYEKRERKTKQSVRHVDCMYSDGDNNRTIKEEIHTIF